MLLAPVLTRQVGFTVASGGRGGGGREKDSERWKQCSLREVEREGGDRKRDVDRDAGGGGGGVKRDAE